MEKDCELVGENVLVTVTVRELVTLATMVAVMEDDTDTTPPAEILAEIADPEETETLVEIPDAAPPVVVILGETPTTPAEADPLRETPVEIESVILPELETEHIRRARVLAKSETTTEATPAGVWAAVTTSMSAGLRVFWVAVAKGHAPNAAALGKKMPDAADPVVVAAAPEK